MQCARERGGLVPWLHANFAVAAKSAVIGKMLAFRAQTAVWILNHATTGLLKGGADKQYKPA